MRIILLQLILSLFAISSSAQIYDPVKWSFSSEAVGENVYTLHFKATIEDGWYVYAQDIPPDGPVPTTFHFEDSANIEFIGALEETGDKIKEGMDKVFEMEIKKFAHGAQFKQNVKLKKGNKLVGYLQYMTCDDEKCLPPTYVDFTFDLVETKSEAVETIETGEETLGQEEASNDSISNSLEESNIESDEGMSMNQILDPVSWKVDAVKNGDAIDITFIATIDEGWFIYSTVRVDGPEPTKAFYLDSTQISSFGEMSETGDDVKEGYDDIFDTNVKKFAKSATFTQSITLKESVKAVEGYIEFMACDHEKCLPPTGVDFKVTADGVITLTTFEATDGGIQENDCTEQFKEDPISDCGIETSNEASSLWINFLKGIIGGFIALLTPCVFPMIPLTVTFFTKRAESKGKGIFDALFYGASIVLVYFLLSVPFLIWEIPPNILNVISADPWVNMVFFSVFIIFAISFFGYFELTLPASIANRADSASDIGGMIGIFFMGLTLAIVSFSCTGPILGTLLVDSLTGSDAGANLSAGMTGFGIALALPFAMFAAFPQLMNKLPKSGGWLNIVKVVLAFLEVGFAMKFASTADMTAQLHLLPREIFLGIWILTGTGLTMYLLGFIKFPHDSPIKKLSKGRIATAIVSAAFTIYLIPGLWGTNLRLVSGFTPPLHYSIAAWNSGDHCPLGLECYHDYEEGLAAAIEQNKPLMIDFTGWACVNCRKMEENVWPEPEVYDLINKEFVLVSLYVDEDQKLPKEEQFYSEFLGTKVRTVGGIWADFQAKNFGANAQPMYVLLDHNCRRLNPQVFYTPDVNAYKNFLQCGLDAFKASNATASNQP